VSDFACVLLFVKAPQPGQVKTRLAKRIGVVHATRLYECFVSDTLQNLRQLNLQLLVCYTPVSSEVAVKNWLIEQQPDMIFQAQQGEDLGAKLHHAFAQAFQLGYRQAIALGSDSPDLPIAYLQQAIMALNGETVVIGPAADGGYYTIGFTQAGFLPQVFEQIAWSTATVYAETLARLKNQPVYSLPTWFDVDTLADLKNLYERLQTNETDCQTLRYLNQHQRVIFGGNIQAII
jgi:uncharacterized protein